jgi:hypothetical protein
MSAGAYGFTMASNYNSHPKPPGVLVMGQVLRHPRPRNLDDLIRVKVSLPAALQMNVSSRIKEFSEKWKSLYQNAWLRQ